jgi:hypothetical protein
VVSNFGTPLAKYFAKAGYGAPRQRLRATFAHVLAKLSNRKISREKGKPPAMEGRKAAGLE